MSIAQEKQFWRLLERWILVILVQETLGVRFSVDLPSEYHLILCDDPAVKHALESSSQSGPDETGPDGE
jgi:hypothetical protein